MLDEYRGIPRQAQLLVVLSIVPSVAIGWLATDISYYLTTIQGVPTFWGGLTISTFAYAVVGSSIPLGILADRFGRRKMLILGNICQGASLLGFALTTNVGLLVVFGATEGVGEAAFAVSLSALIADRAGDAKRTPAFSLGFFLNWIGMAFGAALTNFAGVVPNAELFELVGLASVAVTPIALVVTDTPHLAGPRKSILPRKSGQVLKRYGVYAACLGLGSGFFVTLMSQWFKGRYGVPDSVSGNVLVLSYVVTAGVILLAPRLAKRIGTVKAIVATQAPATIIMLGVPASPVFAIAGTVYIVRVFLMNLGNPLGQSLLMGLVSPDERGAASGLVAVANRLPSGLTALPGLILIGEGQFYYPFYFAAVLYAIGITWFWLAFRKEKLPEESQGARTMSSRPSWKDSLTPSESPRP
ncbi:MAG TPA: MFS transporter [Nitrososphaerales archaeon]|nr:MFS transporter [Nitrososphaerales archaeon]